MTDTLRQVCFELCSHISNGRPGSYFEAGANDGLRQSNTLALEQELGWRGILVEPSPAFEQLVTNRAQDNIFVNKALVKDEGVSEISGLFYGNLGDTADQEIRKKFETKRQPINHKERARRMFVRARKRLRGISPSPNKALVSVGATTLEQIVSESGLETLDFFSLDVEGMELEAIRGFKFSIRPRILVIETRQRDALLLLSILLEQDYTLVGKYPASWSPNYSKPELNFANLIWLRNEDSNFIGQLQALL